MRAGSLRIRIARHSVGQSSDIVHKILICLTITRVTYSLPCGYSSGEMPIRVIPVTQVLNALTILYV